MSGEGILQRIWYHLSWFRWTDINIHCDENHKSLSGLLRKRVIEHYYFTKPPVLYLHTMEIDIKMDVGLHLTYFGITFLTTHVTQFRKVLDHIVESKAFPSCLWIMQIWIEKCGGWRSRKIKLYGYIIDYRIIRSHGKLSNPIIVTVLYKKVLQLAYPDWIL